MNKLFTKVGVWVFTAASLLFTIASPAQTPAKNYAIVIHGGAGFINEGNTSKEKRAAYTQAMNSALEAGYWVLENGGSAVDAVVAAIKIMEDNPLFNAGKGSVLTADGKVEMDASVMDGKSLRAGAVAGLTTIKNPVTAARFVMDSSQHVFMIGSGAEEFARKMQCESVNTEYFITPERRKSFERLQQQKDNAVGILEPVVSNPEFKFGTVGAVALDKFGNLAAATSTGGMSNKKFGRVGDVAVIGAGTYANNKTCAISCTGWGEFFIRLVMAKTVSDKMEYQQLSLEDASNEMIHRVLPEMGGNGGLIGIDKNGNVVMPFCTEGMFRAFKKSSGEKQVLMF